MTDDPKSKLLRLLFGGIEEGSIPRRALFALGQVLPDELLGRLIALIYSGVRGTQQRSELVAEFLHRVPSEERERVVRMVLRDARRSPGKDAASALQSLEGLLPEATLDEALSVAVSLDEPRWRAVALARLARRLPLRLRAQAIEAAAAIAGDELALVTALLCLAPYVPDEALEKARQASIRIETQSLRKLIVQTLDEAWSRDPDPLPRLRALIDECPPDQRRVILERLAHVFPPASEMHFAPPVLPEETALREIVTMVPVAEQRDFLAEALGDALHRVAPAKANGNTRGARPTDVRGERPGDAQGASPNPQRVGFGFATTAAPGEPLASSNTLRPGQRYWLWVEIGPRRRRGSIAEDGRLPASLPKDARVRVALFGFRGHLRIEENRRDGELTLRPGNLARVSKKVASPRNAPPSAVDTRLFFPLKTPGRPGTYRLRLNVYYRDLLLQSHLISAHVGRRSAPLKGSLTAKQDYTLSHSLDLKRLEDVPPHRLSLLINENDRGTHGFHFAGAEDFSGSAEIDVGKLEKLTDYAREALRLAAWGQKTPWLNEVQTPFRYDGTVNLARLEEDLRGLAIPGYRIFDEIRSRLGHAQAAKFVPLVRTPGLLQIALKRSASHVLPASLVYDAPIDTGRNAHTLCATFRAAMTANDPLEATKCFRGQCPSRGQMTVVCPSGFWGFRHDLGVPVSLGNQGDATPSIAFKDAVHLGVNVSTDPKLTRRRRHEEALKALPAVAWHYADDRDEAIELLKSAPAQIIYFYCHGGVTKQGTPFLEVGARDSEAIYKDNLNAYEISWAERKPLVFLNGCHTTALSPQTIVDFVSGFVVDLQAAGAIGTEITVFEDLAAPFAEDCLRRFCAGARIGEAVRHARLALLKAGTPLGLAYVPFVMPALRLAAST